MPLDTNRDRSKAFTRDEFLSIEAAAIADGNQLVAQMAGVLLDLEVEFEKIQNKWTLLLDKLSDILPLEGFVDREGQVEEAIAKWSGTKVIKSLAELVHGLKTGDVPRQEIAFMHFEHGTPFEIGFKTYWAMQVLACSLSETMKKGQTETGEPDFWNNVTCRMEYNGEVFDLTLQRISGKTVKQQLNEAETKLAKAEARIAELEARNPADAGA